MSSKYGIKIKNLDDDYFMVNSSRYAWVKDDLLVRPCTKLLIQYRMLEDFYNIDKTNTDKDIININKSIFDTIGLVNKILIFRN